MHTVFAILFVSSFLVNAQMHNPHSTVTENDVLIEQKIDATQHRSLKGLNQCHHSYRARKAAYKAIMDTFVYNRLKSTPAVGLSLVVVDGNTILYSNNYGYADYEVKKKVTQKTLFRVGSISKVFTGIAIMQLAEQGLVDIDSPVSTYIPEFTYKTRFPDAAPITIRMLMTHQSGIFGDKISHFYSTTYPSDDFRTYGHFIQNEYVAYPPRYMTAYSNFSVSLLGLVIERVSGMRYEEYMKKYLFKPCDMKTATFDNPSNHGCAELSKAYRDSLTPEPFRYLGDVPAGALNANSSDMACFIQMILQNGYRDQKWVIKPRTLKRMYKQQNTDIALDLPESFGPQFGLSWSIDNRALRYAGKVIGHGGSVSTFQSNLHIIPNQGLGVFVSVNTGDDLSYNAMADISEKALIHALRIMRHIDKPSYDYSSPVITLTDAEMDAYTGTFACNWKGFVEIKKTEGTLIIHENGINCLLIPHADGWFSVDPSFGKGSSKPGYRMTIKTINNERVLFEEELLGTNGDIIQLAGGIEIDTKKPILASWLNRSGTYAVVNQEDNFNFFTHVKIEQNPHNFLLANFYIYAPENSIANIILSPVNDTEALVTGRGRHMSETISYTSCNNHECLHWAGVTMARITDEQTIEARTGVNRQPLSIEQIQQIFETRRNALRQW